MKYNYAPGWNKEKVMAQIKKYNNGNKATEPTLDTCVYQTEDGNRCAIGCFIPDNHISLRTFGSLEKLLKEYPELQNFMPFNDLGALKKFQNCHDIAVNSYVHITLEKWLERNAE